MEIQLWGRLQIALCDGNEFNLSAALHWPQLTSAELVVGQEEEESPAASGADIHKKVFITIIVVSLLCDPSFIFWRPEESPPVRWSPALISKSPSSLIFQSPSSAVT